MQEVKQEREGYIYLASPYSHKDAEVRQYRYEQARQCTAWMLLHGHVVFSPITHCHWMALGHNLPSDWRFWSRIDKVMIEKADVLAVLCIDGWATSVGVHDEIAFARTLGMNALTVLPNEDGSYDIRESYPL